LPLAVDPFPLFCNVYFTCITRLRSGSQGKFDNHIIFNHLIVHQGIGLSCRSTYMSHTLESISFFLAFYLFQVDK
jgi:hypothetical protein